MARHHAQSSRLNLPVQEPERPSRTRGRGCGAKAGELAVFDEWAHAGRSTQGRLELMAGKMPDDGGKLETGVDARLDKVREGGNN